MKKAKNITLGILKLPSKWFRGLYNWTKHWSKTKQAPYALFVIAFAESSFFPIPPDVLLIPMVVSHLKKWFRNALITTLGSILGAIFGYFIGWALWEAVGVPIVDFYGLHEQVQEIGRQYEAASFLTIFGFAFTPIPFKVVTISAGLFKLPLWILILASLLGRGMRFFAVAGILRIFGKKISDWIEKYFDWFTLGFTILLVGGFLVIKYLI